MGKFNEEIVKDWLAEQAKKTENEKVKACSINHNTDNSTCHNCKRKDEYIIELEKENEELKKAIKELQEYVDLMRRLP